MPRTNSRGNHGGPKVEVHHISGGTATDNYVPTSQGDGTAAWEAQAGGGISDGDKGDITVSGSGATFTIDNNAVTYAKIQTVTASRLLGNDGSGTACEELTPDTTEFAFGTASVKLQNKVVGRVLRIILPATTAAEEDVRVGGSTPAENFPVWLFDAATDEYLDLYCQLDPCYAGRGLTLRIGSTSASATSGAAYVGAAIRRFADDAEDIDSSHSYDFNYVSITAPSASGEIVYDDITFTSGADMDSLAAGEFFILRLYRDANGTNGTDDMTGDWQFVSVSIRETN